MKQAWMCALPSVLTSPPVSALTGASRARSPRQLQATRAAWLQRVERSSVRQQASAVLVGGLQAFTTRRRRRKVAHRGELV